MIALTDKNNYTIDSSQKFKDNSRKEDNNINYLGSKQLEKLEKLGIQFDNSTLNKVGKEVLNELINKLKTSNVNADSSLENALFKNTSTNTNIFNEKTLIKSDTDIMFEDEVLHTIQKSNDIKSEKLGVTTETTINNLLNNQGSIFPINLCAEISKLKNISNITDNNTLDSDRSVVTIPRPIKINVEDFLTSKNDTDDFEFSASLASDLDNKSAFKKE